MSYPRIYHKVFNEPWLIEPSAHRALSAALLQHERGAQSSLLEIEPCDPEEDGFERIGSTARIAIDGVIGKRLSLMESLCGGVDLNAISQALAEAVADPAIETIVLDINSPGGTVTGVPEFAAAVRKARDIKPVIAYTETLMASAAYWIASQADSIIAAPSARVGSIGVYRTWLDDSAALNQEGYKRELFEAGAHKAAGLRPITTEERIMFQAEVEQIHAEFKAAVLAGRTVPDEAMQGRVYWGAEAARLGLVDAFADDWSEVEALLAV